MPRCKKLNPDKDHVTCYICNKLVQYDGFVKHWSTAGHNKTERTSIDFARLDPKPLYGGPLEPARVETILHSIIGGLDVGSGQFGEDDDSVVETWRDEVYENAGMQVLHKALTFFKGFPPAKVSVTSTHSRMHETNFCRNERSSDIIHSMIIFNMQQPRNCHVQWQ